MLVKVFVKLLQIQIENVEWHHFMYKPTGKTEAITW
jgi:hypothetical protein